jgi:hypothetical protein
MGDISPSIIIDSSLPKPMSRAGSRDSIAANDTRQRRKEARRRD